MRLTPCILAAALALAPACSDGGDGEPIAGSIAFDWGDDHVVPTVGTTFANEDEPGEMYVLLGTTGLDCDTTLDSPVAPGTYLMFSVSHEAPGSHAPLVTLIRVEAGSARFRGRSGAVTIDAIGAERIAGSVTMEGTDDEVGRLAANGTFDVARCF